MFLVLLALACSPSEEVVDLPLADRGGSSSGSTVDSGDTGISGDWEPQLSTQCGARGVEEPTSAEQLLEPAWCIRLSPDSLEDRAGDTGNYEGDIPVPPPCSYFNLLGSLALRSDPMHPEVLFCDADTPGGVYFARVDGETETVESVVLADDSCYTDADTGAILSTDQGSFLAWVDLQMGPALMTRRISQSGVLEEAQEVGFEGPRRIQEAGNHLLVVDQDEALWALPIAEGRIEGEALALLEQASTMGAVATETGFLHASCSGYQSTPVVQSVEDSQIGWETSLDGSCGADSRPDIAVGESLIAVVWEGEEQGHLALLDLDGVEQGRLDLGDSARYPRVASLSDGFVLVDGSGAVRRLDSAGQQTDSWVHPDIVDAVGNLAGLRLVVDEESWGFALLGQVIDTTDLGHISSYFYLELSAVSVP
jgi:hypothetical protein